MTQKKDTPRRVLLFGGLKQYRCRYFVFLFAVLIDEMKSFFISMQRSRMVESL